MTFSFEDIKKYTEKAPEHSTDNFQIVLSLKDGEKSIKPEIKSITQRLARQKSKNPNLLWYIGESYHSSRGKCKKTTKKSGKRGRPSVIVQGKKSVPHAHIFLMSNKGNDSVKTDYLQILSFIKKRQKRFGVLKQAKSSGMKGVGYVSYVWRQSEHIYSTPNYNWDYFLSPMYDDTINNFE